MFSWLVPRSCGCLGFDLGARWLKLVQMNAEGTRLIDAARIEMPALTDESFSLTDIQEAITKAREGRRFSGNRVAVCLSNRHFLLQNIRVPKTAPQELENHLRQELAGRISEPVEDYEIRYLEAGEVRQGSDILRELIVFATPRAFIEDLLATLDSLGLQVAGIDVEPLAILRASTLQYRRDEDRALRRLFLHIGYEHSLIMVAQGDEPLIIKYLDVGGKDLDAALAAHLEMDLAQAASLRRGNGDRRATQHDPEIQRSVEEAVLPVLEKIMQEVALCQRYHMVTFRGRTLDGSVLGGGEASPGLVELLQRQWQFQAELSEPFRGMPEAAQLGRKSQWEVAAGLSLWETSA